MPTWENFGCSLTSRSGGGDIPCAAMRARQFPQTGCSSFTYFSSPKVQYSKRLRIFAEARLRTREAANGLRSALLLDFFSCCTAGAASRPRKRTMERQGGRRSHEARLLRVQELGGSIEPHARYALKSSVLIACALFVPLLFRSLPRSGCSVKGRSLTFLVYLEACSWRFYSWITGDISAAVSISLLFDINNCNRR